MNCRALHVGGPSCEALEVLAKRRRMNYEREQLQVVHFECADGHAWHMTTSLGLGAMSRWSPCNCEGGR